MADNSFDINSALKHSPEECYQIALRYISYYTVDTDKKAVIYFRRAADSNYAAAQFKLARLYERGRGVDKNFTEAATWYIRAAENKHVAAQCHLGLLYAKGRGVPRDPKKSIFWYEQAAALGNRAAQNNLAIMYEYGYGTPKNLQQAIFWYRQAADKGDPQAKKAVQRLLHKPKGFFEKLKEMFAGTPSKESAVKRLSDNDDDD